jgi:preprotein translocase subunit SecG
MTILLYLVFVFASILLCIVVLIQEGKGGGLGGAFGGAGQQTFGVGTRGITRFTAGVVAVMLLSAIGIHLLGQRASDSMLDDQYSSPSLLESAPTDAPIEPR